MDVLEDAIYDFSEVLEFFQEWKTAMGPSKKDEDIEGESVERYLFLTTMKRHVSIAKKLMIDLYDDFDVCVVEKDRNPFVIKRPGKKNRKMRFGRRKYTVNLETQPEEIFQLFQETTNESFTKKELDMVNRLYNGTLKICRLQNFIDDIKTEPASEKGQEVTVEVTTASGNIIRGILTYSTNGSTAKEIEQHLEVTHTCRNMTGVEVYFIGDVEFGLKLILAKLKRMKTPYVTPILNVVKVCEVRMGTAKVAEQPVPVYSQEMAEDVPPEGLQQEFKVKPFDDKTITVVGEGSGDASSTIPVIGWKDVRIPDDKFSSPFAEHPQPNSDSDSDTEPLKPQVVLPGRIDSVTLPSPRIPRSICIIQ